MSSEDFEGVANLRRARREIRRRFGEPCKECQARLPKAHPSILLPGQACKIHPWYVDTRPRVPKEDVDAVYREYGLEPKKEKA